MQIHNDLKRYDLRVIQAGRLTDRQTERQIDGQPDRQRDGVNEGERTR